MIILAFGSNLKFKKNFPKDIITFAYQELERNKLRIIKKSSFYETESYPNKNDPKFINSAVAVQTSIDPLNLLKLILKIEKKFGRIRLKKNEPRTLDIDIIDYNGVVQNYNEEQYSINLPHSKAQDRLFVLYPILDINPNWIHPMLNIGIKDILKNFSKNELKNIKKIVE